MQKPKAENRLAAESLVLMNITYHTREQRVLISKIRKVWWYGFEGESVQAMTLTDGCNTPVLSVQFGMTFGFRKTALLALHYYIHDYSMKKLQLQNTTLCPI